MKKNLLAILLFLLVAPVFAQNDNTHYVQTSIDSGRYEIIQSPIVRRNLFKLDKQTGKVSQYVKCLNGLTIWEDVYIEGLLDLPSEQENTYQIFMGGFSVADCFLLNTKTGETWIYVKASDNFYLFQKMV